MNNMHTVKEGRKVETNTLQFIKLGFSEQRQLFEQFKSTCSNKLFSFTYISAVFKTSSASREVIGT